MISTTKFPKKIKSYAESFLIPKVPKRLRKMYRSITEINRDAIESSLRVNYFLSDELYLSSEEGQEDLHKHLYQRLNKFRKTVIPWLDNARPLKGASILEIGCGTGSSTVALAEQGAKITAIDIHEGSLAVAKERCEAYGLNVDFHKINATDVHKIFHNRHFDFIIFFATLEHMTHEERMVSISSTWNMLGKGDLWCAVDTPNRLWFYDGHTSWLPFYHWLPDDLAFKYSRFSPRKSFCNKYHKADEEAMKDFLRKGRGVSFHEFELTMGVAEDLDIVSSLPIFLRKRNILRYLLLSFTDRSHYESFLVKIRPRIHRGFYQQDLALIIRKN